jgi:transcriptional regulator GlxA family with amidase domain
MFDGVEVLDFAGPFEVFGVAGVDQSLYEVFTVAETDRPVVTRNMLSINPDYTFESMPSADVLVVPGGYGTRREKHNPTVLKFIKEKAAAAHVVLSVCSGALLLAKAGLLNGLKATTHHGALAELAADEPNCRLCPDARVVDNGKIVVSAGISMGIEAALYTVARHHGLPLACATADYMEYDWKYQSVDGKHVVRSDPGEYTVAAYQDINGNEKLDTNLIGIPKEPNAISNDAPARFGPPRYEDAKFTVGKDNLQITVTLGD